MIGNVGRMIGNVGRTTGNARAEDQERGGERLRMRGGRWRGLGRSREE